VGILWTCAWRILKVPMRISTNPSDIRRITLAAGVVAAAIKILHPGVVLALLAFTGAFFALSLWPWCVALLITGKNSVWMRAGQAGKPLLRDAAIAYGFGALSLIFGASIIDGSFSGNDDATSLVITVLNALSVSDRAAEYTTSAIWQAATLAWFALLAYFMYRYIQLRRTVAK
jgi:hypothetical protein